MSAEQARIDIMTVVSQIVTDWTAYPLQVEAPNWDVIDQATQANPYLQVDIDLLGGEQKTVGLRPVVRQYGQVLLCVVSKGGTGTSAGNVLGDFILPYFDLQTLGTVRTHAVLPVKGKGRDGWWYQPWLVDFWYDRVKS